MDLSNIDLKKILPQFMRHDDFFAALSDAMSGLFQEYAINVESIFWFDKIEEQPEKKLDEIAQENNLFWYFKDDNIEIKRKNIKSFKKVLYSLGTPSAIKSMLEDIYENAELQESFEYPDDYLVHEFGVQVQKLSNFSEENKNRLFKRINDVKRASQKLKEIFYYDKSKIKGYMAIGECCLIEEYTKPIAWPNSEIPINLICDYGINIYFNLVDCSAVAAE